MTKPNPYKAAAKKRAALDERVVFVADRNAMISFDAWAAKHDYRSRSEALRELVYEKVREHYGDDSDGFETISEEELLRRLEAIAPQPTKQ